MCKQNLKLLSMDALFISIITTFLSHTLTFWVCFLTSRRRSMRYAIIQIEALARTAGFVNIIVIAETHLFYCKLHQFLFNVYKWRRSQVGWVAILFTTRSLDDVRDFAR